jgi:SAM-dependent methyltransferase
LKKQPGDPPKSVRESYDSVAADYAVRILHELEGKPLDRALLDEIAARTSGLICDLGLGCGPGPVTRYLHERQALICGVDISPGMIGGARKLTPGLRFEVGDMRALGFQDESLGAVVAMYSLIHLDWDELALAIHEIGRVLDTNGILLASFHRGSEVHHLQDLWGHPVDLDFHFFEPSVISPVVEAAGLRIEKIVERDPYAGVEVNTSRFYLVAVKSGHEPRSSVSV